PLKLFAKVTLFPVVKLLLLSTDKFALYHHISGVYLPSKVRLYYQNNTSNLGNRYGVHLKSFSAKHLRLY
ncbi:hypothetical protein, partial [Vibrio parahaemolyticus]|uniref:hypothetical protein n=1 Tax=Vibrio parahaemolyticus TaxID=670 RepID=UPI001BAEF1AF